MFAARVVHVGVTAADPIALEQFYVTYFGFQRARVFTPGPDQIVMLKLNDFYLEIFKAAERRPANSPTESGPCYPSWRHLCFHVDDLDAALENLEGAAKLTLGPSDLSELIPGMKVAWLADPEGNIIELNQGYMDESNPPGLRGKLSRS